MLTILKANRESTEQIFLEKIKRDKDGKVIAPTKRPPKHDITVTKTVERVEYNKDGSKTIRQEQEKTNITRQINETAKVVKQQDALQKLEQLKNLIK